MATKPPQTKPSTPRLSEVARHLKVPSGIVTTGWPAVEAKAAEVGIHYDWWQRAAGQVTLGKRADGKYAATIGGIIWSIPRQVGKTFTVGSMLVMLCLIFPGLKVVWTAHRTRTTTNTFRSMQGMVKRAKIWPHIENIRLANGEQEIVFKNGSIIMFGAREQGFGRGIDEIDVEVFDEAQILTIKALEDMIAATNQARHPHGALLFFIGTPPRPTDPGEAFEDKRQQALDGEDDLFYLELSADSDADPDDRAQWSKANLSYPTRTPLESMLRLRKNLPGVDAWRREGLGIWDERARTDPVVPLKVWNDLGIEDDTQVPSGDPDYYSLTMSPERIAFIGVGINTPDGSFVDIAEAGRMDDSRKVIEWFTDRRKAGKKVTVAIDTRDPAASLVNELRANKIKVNVTTQSDSGRACTGLIDDIEAARIEHCNQPVITAALRVARKKPIGKAGLWEWDLEDPTSELAALRAITLARFGLTFKTSATSMSFAF